MTPEQRRERNTWEAKWSLNKAKTICDCAEWPVIFDAGHKTWVLGVFNRRGGTGIGLEQGTLLTFGPGVP